MKGSYIRQAAIGALALGLAVIPGAPAVAKVSGEMGAARPCVSLSAEEIHGLRVSADARLRAAHAEASARLEAKLASETRGWARAQVESGQAALDAELAASLEATAMVEAKAGELCVPPPACGEVTASIDATFEAIVRHGSETMRLTADAVLRVVAGVTWESRVTIPAPPVWHPAAPTAEPSAAPTTAPTAAPTTSPTASASPSTASASATVRIGASATTPLAGIGLATRLRVATR